METEPTEGVQPAADLGAEPEPSYDPEPGAEEQLEPASPPDVSDAMAQMGEAPEPQSIDPLNIPLAPPPDYFDGQQEQGDPYGEPGYEEQGYDDPADAVEDYTDAIRAEAVEPYVAEARERLVTDLVTHHPGLRDPAVQSDFRDSLEAARAEAGVELLDIPWLAERVAVGAVAAQAMREVAEHGGQDPQQQAAAPEQHIERSAGPGGRTGGQQVDPEEQAWINAVTWKPPPSALT